VASLANQRRRERRLIQKAPADSATRTPIHPAKRSSEDRCMVSGSSIEDEGIPLRPCVVARRREPQRHPRARTGRLLRGPHGARAHQPAQLAGRTRLRPPRNDSGRPGRLETTSQYSFSGLFRGHSPDMPDRRYSKRMHLQAFRHAGGGTRTPDTRIVIQLDWLSDRKFRPGWTHRWTQPHGNCARFCVVGRVLNVQ
jgi:hypothetical protein